MIHGFRKEAYRGCRKTLTTLQITNFKGAFALPDGAIIDPGVI